MKKQEELLKQWKEVICNNAEKIDPSQEYIWHGLFIGFMLGKGCTIKEATDLLFYNKGFYLEGHKWEEYKNHFNK